MAAAQTRIKNQARDRAPEELRGDLRALPAQFNPLADLAKAPVERRRELEHLTRR
jgi:hypothetical protein